MPSVPGTGKSQHKEADLHKYGHMRVRSLLSSEKPLLEEGGHKVVFQFSSLSSLTDSPVCAISLYLVQLCVYLPGKVVYLSYTTFILIEMEEGPSVFPCVYLCLSACLCVCLLSVCVSVFCLSIFASVFLSACLSVCVCLSICLAVDMFVCLSLIFCLSVCAYTSMLLSQTVRSDRTERLRRSAP